jgi:hypothetical protein
MSSTSVLPGKSASPSPDSFSAQNSTLLVKMNTKYEVLGALSKQDTTTTVAMMTLQCYGGIAFGRLARFAAAGLGCGALMHYVHLGYIRSFPPHASQGTCMQARTRCISDSGRGETASKRPGRRVTVRTACDYGVLYGRGWWLGCSGQDINQRHV